MKVYRIDVQICATAYIKASSAKAALNKAKTLEGHSPSILDHAGGVIVSDAAFSSPQLPEISLSPAMTITGLWRNAEVEEAE